MKQIASDVDDLSAGAGTNCSSAEGIAAMAIESANGASEMASGTTRVTEAIVQVSASSEETSASAEEVSASTEELSAAVGRTRCNGECSSRYGRGTNESRRQV